ncbi:MAG TPA: 16S rRNA (cytosine(1402)-N(4))-methyltransferase RsmH [Planctomycetota bacterium]|nr:16S rRNA (cytosine(1402)-N(4))-methyltransferase RsmH [Planctomycetota bacterium]
MTEAPWSHTPVMAGEVMALLGAAPGHFLADLTVGAGGHAAAFLRATAPTGTVCACDRDRRALDLARARLEEEGLASRARFVQGTFTECLAQLAAGERRPDAVLIDLGVSSMQLDDPGRGFSLRSDGPLDMRMDETRGETASHFLQHARQSELEQAFGELGGEPSAQKIARALVERRTQRPFRSTGDLRSFLETVLGRRGGKIHPATRTFQGLRMAVNRELPQLTEALPAALAALAEGGRLAVISFHSGEDRLVKAFMQSAAARGHELLTRKAVQPSREESRSNRRSRSARLRVLRKSARDSA